MICIAKPILTQVLCVVQKEEFSITRRKYNMYAWKKVRDKPILTSEREFHNDYYGKCTVKEKNGVILKGLDVKMIWVVVNRQS
jgi:hypothetical protein